MMELEVPGEAREDGSTFFHTLCDDQFTDPQFAPNVAVMLKYKNSARLQQECRHLRLRVCQMFHQNYSKQFHPINLFLSVQHCYQVRVFVPSLHFNFVVNFYQLGFDLNP